MGKVKTHLLRIVVPVFLIVFLSGCHSDYVILDYDMHHGACYNQDSSKIALFVSTFGFLPAKGLSRFPDGGQAKMLHENVTLFLMTTDSTELTRIADFPELTAMIGARRLAWETKLCFKGDSLFFQVSPTSDFDFIKAYTEKYADDSVKINAVKNKYGKCVLYHPDLSSIRAIEAARNCFDEAIKADFMTAKHLLDSFSLKEIGLDLLEVHPKSKKHYLKGLQNGKINSELTRRAINEQLTINNEPASFNQQSAINNQQSAINNQQSTISNQQSTINN
jgi:hypothetical protein